MENQQRLIIQNATLNMVVEDVTAKVAEIRDLAAQYDGWVVASNTSSRIVYDDVTQDLGSITIRVAADNFDEALSAMKAVGVLEIESETITGEDVTERYVDLNSRLRSKRTSYDQLSELMQSATDVQDVLDVQAELERFQTEIEVLEGQIRFLEESAAYSSIRVELSTEIPERPDDEDEDDEPWQPIQTAEDAFAGLIVVLQAMVDLLIVVAVFVLPLTIIVGLPSWLIYKRVRPYFQSSGQKSTAHAGEQAETPFES